jgi:hypothetical protein
MQRDGAAPGIRRADVWEAVMLDTTILGKRHALGTLHVEPRESGTTRKVIAAAIAAFLAIAVLA